MDIHMTELGGELRGFLRHNPDRLSVIARHSDFMPGVEAYILEKARPPNCFLRGICKGQKFGFRTKCCNRFLLR